MSDGLRWHGSSETLQHKVSLTRTAGGNPSPQSPISTPTDAEPAKKRGGWPKGKPRGREFGAKVSAILKARNAAIREGKQP